MQKRTLSRDQIKLAAALSMTVDHLTSAVVPGYSRNGWVLLLHIFGRVAAPVFWFFLVEGYHHTRDLKRYAARLLAFAAVSHFAYNFAFGIPLIPFRSSVFNQTSVIWALFWGLAALVVEESETLAGWQKILLIAAIAAVSFCADWSCIAVFAILEINRSRGDFKGQMVGMMFWVTFYVVVYMAFIDPLYGLLQLFTALAIPLLSRYDERAGGGQPQGPGGGSVLGAGLKRWFFYLYYPLHLIFCGLLRLALHGDMAGGL